MRTSVYRIAAAESPSTDPKVALPIDKHGAHRKRLRHPHHGFINGTITMGVIFADDIAYDPG